MDKITKLLEETQNLLEGFSSGSLSPVSSYYANSGEEELEEPTTVAAAAVVDKTILKEFKKLLKSENTGRIVKFVEASRGNLTGALHAAIEEKCKDLEVFKALLRNGCDPLEQNSEFKTALTRFVEQKGDNFDCSISTLLGEWELRRAATRESKLFNLIHLRNWKEFYSHLPVDPVKILCNSDPKFAGISPLHEIAATNNVTMMKKLVSKFESIDLNVKAIGSGNTPLHEACHMSATEMINLLIEFGARCDIKNASGKVPAQLGNENIQVMMEIKNLTVKKKKKVKEIKENNFKTEKQSTTPANSGTDSISREERKLKQIIGFLDEIEKQNDTNLETILQRESHSGRTILHRFARRNQSEKLIKFLKVNEFTESKCRELKLFEVIDNSGHCPLYDAASEGSLETVKIFLFGSKPAKLKNLLINPSIPAAITGDTPLHAAAASGNVEIIELLLSVGADRNATNIEGLKPIDMTNLKNVRKLLKEKEKIIEETKVTRVTGVTVTDVVVKSPVIHSNEVPIKRGPGRPRKHPHPDSVKIVKTDSVSIPSQSSQSSQSSQLNLPLNEILNDGSNCVILVKFHQQNWLMLSNHFIKIYNHLSSINNSSTPQNYSKSFEQISENDLRKISNLPTTGNLIEILKSNLATCQNFISKAAAIEIFEKDFNVNFNGPFGYIDVQKLSTSSEPMYSGCPLKLKMKMQKFEQFRRNSTGSSSNWLVTAPLEETIQPPKSPKSFQF